MFTVHFVLIYLLCVVEPVLCSSSSNDGIQQFLSLPPHLSVTSKTIPANEGDLIDSILLLIGQHPVNQSPKMTNLIRSSDTLKFARRIFILTSEQSRSKLVNVLERYLKQFRKVTSISLPWSPDQLKTLHQSVTSSSINSHDGDMGLIVVVGIIDGTKRNEIQLDQVCKELTNPNLDVCMYFQSSDRLRHEQTKDKILKRSVSSSGQETVFRDPNAHWKFGLILATTVILLGLLIGSLMFFVISDSHQDRSGIIYTGTTPMGRAKQD